MPTMPMPFKPLLLPPFTTNKAPSSDEMNRVALSILHPFPRAGSGYEARAEKPKKKKWLFNKWSAMGLCSRASPWLFAPEPWGGAALHVATGL